MSRWFPDLNGFKFQRNESWLNSAWIGITAPIINLPVILWRTVISAFLEGVLTALICLVILAFSIPRTMFLGLVGRLSPTTESERSAKP